jgi:hypothetical protein
VSDTTETQPGAIISKLREYNLWRRGSEQLAQPNPTEIGLCLEAVCDVSEKLKRERDEARKRMMEAIVERERWKMRAEEKLGMRVELEELLGVKDTQCNEQFAKGLAALRDLIKERDELRADQINHENLSMRYMDERDEAREAFAVATSNCVDAQQQLRTARNLADAAMWEADRLRCAIKQTLPTGAKTQKNTEQHEQNTQGRKRDDQTAVYIDGIVQNRRHITLHPTAVLAEGHRDDDGEARGWIAGEQEEGQGSA